MELYEKSLYTQKERPFIFNENIYEYDISKAGLSISKEFKLLDENTLDRLFSIKDKKELQIEIGNIQLRNSSYKNKLMKGFTDARKYFFDGNNINDDDIISIKKDAIFTTKKCDNTKFGYIDFRLKNTYSSFIILNKLELYYDKRKMRLDVKGISDDKLEFHTKYMTKLLIRYFDMMENNSKDYTKKVMMFFINRYKNKKMKVEYYREYNSESVYRDIYGDIHQVCTNGFIKRLDIGYNYKNILIPLIQILLV